MKQRVKQLIILCSLVLGLVFLVYGCGGSDGDGSSGISNTPAPTQTATVTRSVSGNIVPDTDTIIPAVVLQQIIN